MSKFTAADVALACIAYADFIEMTRTPNTSYNVKLWWDRRIKPAKKLIDMAHFIKSGIDMEFWDDASDSYTPISILDSINVGVNHAFVSKLSCYKHCRPRMNHKHFHYGSMCPVPEGFKGNVYLRNDDMSTKIYLSDFTHYRWDHEYTSADIIGYEILGLADGWTYPWESKL